MTQRDYLRSLLARRLLELELYLCCLSIPSSFHILQDIALQQKEITKILLQHL